MYINLSETLASIHTIHEQYAIADAPTSLYEPRNYIMAMSGKKMRALLCCLAYGLYKEDVAEVMDLAYSVELFHNFTLVHDDIMDDADLRRGVPAVHKEYNTNAAILSGDVMLIEVYERLSKMSDPAGYISALSKVAREVCEGQAMDMDFEVRDDVTIAEYLEMIELKTAVLLGLCLRLGAKQAGASEFDQERLHGFGKSAGVGFQIQDDYLDVYGDPNKFGKKVGGDILQGKKTYLYLRAIELLEGSAKADFKSIYMSTTLEPSEKIKQVKSVFDELHIPHYCVEAKRAFFDLALSHMTMVSAAVDKKEQLIEWSKNLLDRES